DMVEFYGNNDYNRAKEIIDKYNIEYIYVGKTETMNSVIYNGSISPSDYNNLPLEDKMNYTFYKGNYVRRVNVDHDFMKSLGNVVYDGQTEDLGYSTYIVKVKE
ncbi:MAG: hypothetical protein MJ113_07730, partial [Lachnospiraceae bacterium]|nr:hypothetical protein [Lachnospiraceae bacterium]